MRITTNTVFRKCKDVVVRNIGTETVLVPVKKTLSEKDFIYSLNKTGTIVWNSIDGKNSVKNIVSILSAKVQLLPTIIEKDVLELMKNLLREGLVSE
ncbi:MAG: PqqD family protein [Fibrobacteres bacterium]|nr:PqqD family protein [Fibrobacterota bacterium]